MSATRMRHRCLAILASAVALCCALGIPASAVAGQSSPEPGEVIVVEPQAVEAGSEFTVSGYCRPGGAPATPVVSVYWVGPPGAVPYHESFRPVADAVGGFRTTRRIPGSAPSGYYRARLGCFILDVGYQGAYADFTVTGGTEPNYSTTTPTTGPPPLPPLTASHTAPAPPASPAVPVATASTFAG